MEIVRSQSTDLKNYKNHLKNSKNHQASHKSLMNNNIKISMDDVKKIRERCDCKVLRDRGLGIYVDVVV